MITHGKTDGDREIKQYRYKVAHDARGGGGTGRDGERGREREHDND